jgi:5'-nucleotidase
MNMTRLLLAFILCNLTLPVSAESLRILLTNDDGYTSPGIRAIHESLVRAGHDVYLIAPAEQQSGAASSITSGGVKITKHEGKIWAVHGRPADAVRLGLGQIMKDSPPQLVVSGANFGNNTGVDTNISGTVGAALTALQFGYPAIAISVEIRFAEAKDGFPGTISAFPEAGEFLVRFISEMQQLSRGSIININYPAIGSADVKGVKWASLSSHSILTSKYEKGEDGRWSPQLNLSSDAEQGSDVALLADGFITLTLLDADISTRPSRQLKKLVRKLNRD